MPHKDARSAGGAKTQIRFLDEITLWHVSLPSTVAFSAVGLALGQGTSPLEMLVATNAAPPNAAALCLAWKARNAGRAARGDSRDEAFLVGVLSSLPLDWYARRFVETHVNFFVFNPLPVPRPPADRPLRRLAVELAGRLAAPDERFAAWAKEVGVACGPLAPDEKEDMLHEIDAVVAHLYGLSEKHLVHIFETFHEGWNYEPRLHATLKYFREWERRAKT